MEQLTKLVYLNLDDNEDLILSEDQKVWIKELEEKYDTYRNDEWAELMEELQE